MIDVSTTELLAQISQTSPGNATKESGSKEAQTMMDLELPLCNSPQNMQNKKVHKKIKQICLRVPTNCLDSLRKQFGQFIISEEQSETSEQSTLEWSSSLSDEEYVRETKSDPEPAMNRMSAVRKSLIASINSKSQLPNLSSSDSENEKSTAQKAYRKSKNTKAAAKNIEACTQNFIPKKTQIGSFVFSDSSSDESFVEFRKECQTSNTEYALQCKQSQQEKNTLEGKDTASQKTEEGSNPLNANNGKLLEKMVDPAKPTSEISDKNLKVILKLADRFIMPAVFEQCKQQLRISNLNGAQRLLLAQQYNFKDLLSEFAQEYKTVADVKGLKSEPEYKLLDRDTRCLILGSIAS